LALRVEALALRVEALALRVEALALRVEASTLRVEALALRFGLDYITDYCFVSVWFLEFLYQKYK